MKTLRRKTLEELKAIMPVIPETEQAMYNGGTIYCDLSGVYLGKVGSGDDLMFCSRLDYESYESNNIEGMGVSYSSLDNSAQYNFILQNSSFSNVQINEGGNCHAGLTKDGTLYVNSNASSWKNYNDALSTLNHEWYHYENGHYRLTGIALVQAEIDTYMYQIKSGNFASTSDNYKKTTADSLYDYYQQKGISVSREELYHLVGL